MTIALAALLLLGLCAGLHAQTRPLSTTGLSLKVAGLEKELAGVRDDFAPLVTECQGLAAQVVQPAVVDASDRFSLTADNIDICKLRAVRRSFGRRRTNTPAPSEDRARSPIG